MMLQIDRSWWLVNGVNLNYHVKYLVLISGFCLTNALTGVQINLPSDAHTPDEELLRFQQPVAGPLALTAGVSLAGADSAVRQRPASPVSLLPARYCRQAVIRPVTPLYASVSTQTEINPGAAIEISVSNAARTPGLTPVSSGATPEPSASELIFKTALWLVLTHQD